MKAFKAYDIRGIYNQDFNKDDVYKIGYNLPKLLEANRVLVGRDVRLSSPEIFDSLAEGITDSGADVYAIGLATTPMVYYATARHKFPASVQITASHNSKEYNGLKISREKALPVGYETGLDKLEKMITENQIIKSEQKGKIIDYNIKNDYIDFFQDYLDDISGLKIAVDCSNGMAGLVIRQILGDAPIYIYEQPDGRFPNHDPNPLLQKNVEDLKQKVKEENCDLGIIFDGDGDRVMFVDEKANFISPDLITAVMADYFLKGDVNADEKRVLHDIRTSRSVSEYIEKLGGNTYMWKVGHAYAKRKLREIDGLYGGELAGHYYFRNFYYCDSGILAAVIVLTVANGLCKKGKSIGDLIGEIKKYYFSGEINFTIEDKQQMMKNVKDYFTGREKPLAVHDFDGYRVEFRNWWFNIRPSNTEPYLRLVAEAKSEELLEEKLNKIRTILGKKGE